MHFISFLHSLPLLSSLSFLSVLCTIRVSSQSKLFNRVSNTVITPCKIRASSLSPPEGPDMPSIQSFPFPGSVFNFCSLLHTALFPLWADRPHSRACSNKGDNWCWLFSNDLPHELCCVISPSDIPARAWSLWATFMLSGFYILTVQSQHKGCRGMSYAP